jgi:exodeoxyribonuclease V
VINDWSPQQERALKLARQWMNARDKQVFRLFGYAGTGKTTLARELGSYRVTRYVAFTGKAAHVMRQRGCDPVSTIHTFLYYAEYIRKQDRWYFTKREQHESAGIQLIIVDEPSMVPQPLALDLLSLGIPVFSTGRSRAITTA